MSTHLLRAAAASLVAALALTACPAPVQECLEGDEPVCDGGSLPPDLCNSREEADQDAVNCHLVVNVGGGDAGKSGVFISRIADGGVDRDWYVARMPALNPRSLLRVRGGYSGVPQSAVNFSLNLLAPSADGGALQSIATAVDRHGAAAPRSVDIVLPFNRSDTNVYLVAGDEGSGTQLRVDNRNPYSLFVQVQDNPDLNEPNDVGLSVDGGVGTETPIPLTGSPLEGQRSGYLATNNDVDFYTFQVPAGARQIIYLTITGPMTTPPPTPGFGRLTYTLFNPLGQPVSEATVANDGVAINLATARLAAQVGTYTLRVQGYREVGATLVRGDLTVKYDVTVKLFPDLDTNEPNDELATARTVSPAPNSTTTLTGKLSWVGDEEWFLVTLPARPSPSVLRWRTTVATAGGRFPPTTGVPLRQTRILTRVTQGATVTERQANCVQSRAACPKGFDDPNGDQGELVGDLCRNSSPTQCLLVQRNEEPQFTNLRNHVGGLPVEQNKTTELYLMFRDEGRRADKYADDRDWRIEFSWFDDADEASRVAGPTVVPLSGTTASASGVLNFGYGLLLGEPNLSAGRLLRGPNDYDAYPTDRDLFRFDFGGATGDQGWQLEWELAHPDGGTAPPGDLTLEFNFCRGTGPVPDGGLCAGQEYNVLAYTSDRLSPWYEPNNLATAKVLYDKRVENGATIITARPVGCWCFSAARTAGGRFFANVAAVDRTSNEPLRYTLRQAIAPYPTSFIGADGGTFACPVDDGGCRFGSQD